MDKPKCSLDDCEDLVRARGWCNKHWQTWRTYGSPYGPQLSPLPTLPGERWLPVADWEGLYEVSHLGRVRSMDRVVRRGRTGRYVKPGRLLAQWPDRMGYWCVNLSDGDRRATVKVHRLVGEAFLGPLPSGQETRHGPEGKLQNRASELCYGTRLDNAADKFRDGTQPQGSRVRIAKLTEDIVRDCRTRYAAGDALMKTLATEYGVSLSTMYSAITGATWRHVA